MQNIPSVKTENGTAQITFYSDVGGWDGITADGFAAALDDAGSVERIILNLHSYGGDVYEGVTINTLLKKHPAHVRVEIDGAAMSAASFIAMAGDEIAMHEAGLMMIHNAWAIAAGNADDMRELADQLEKVDGTIAAIYAARTRKPLDDIFDVMAAETYFSAEEALLDGFITEIIANKESQDVTAAEVASRFENAPIKVLDRLRYGDRKRDQKQSANRKQFLRRKAAAHFRVG